MCSSMTLFLLQEYLSHKYINYLNGYVFISTIIVSAHSHLNVVCGGLWQLPVEPRRSVEAAACVQRLTTSTIPQRVISVDCMKPKAISTPSITEVYKLLPTYEGTMLALTRLFFMQGQMKRSLSLPSSSTAAANVQMCSLGLPWVRLTST